MNIIPDKYRDLLDRPIVVSLATLMNEGPPQVQPVWCNFDGTQEGDVRVIFKIVPTRVATIDSTMPDLSAST